MDTESAYWLNEFTHTFGAANAHEALFEWMFTMEHGILPEYPRFVEYVEHVEDRDGNDCLIVVMRDPDEVERLQ